MIKVKNSFKYIFLSIISIISIFPFIWMLISMTNKSVDVSKGSLMPGTSLFENIKFI